MAWKALALTVGLLFAHSPALSEQATNKDNCFQDGCLGEVFLYVHGFSEEEYATVIRVASDYTDLSVQKLSVSKLLADTSMINHKNLIVFVPEVTVVQKFFPQIKAPITATKDTKYFSGQFALNEEPNIVTSRYIVFSQTAMDCYAPYCVGNLALNFLRATSGFEIPLLNRK